MFADLAEHANILIETSGSSESYTISQFYEEREREVRERERDGERKRMREKERERERDIEK